MFVSFRTAFMVIAALSGSSVAPAQVNPAAEPLIASGSDALPVQVQPAILTVEDAVKAVDPLAPMSDGDAAEEPQIEPGATLSEKVAQLRSSEPGSRELECLATGIYFESKSESLQGQLAVGHVIANRAESGRFPSSYCGVLFQRSQFSFIRGRSLPSVPRASQDWKDAVAIARIVDQELHPSPMGKALFFHARRVSPGWRLTRVGTLGNHVFYR
jgi:spore germination cell wall hydrolase CwlJ-like protein